MPDHERDLRLLVFRDRQDLRRQLAQSVAVERHKVRYPEPVEDRKQHKLVFDGLPQRLLAQYQSARLFKRRLSVAGRIAPGLHLSVRKSDLELDLLAAQGGGARQSVNLGQGARELRLGLHERRAGQ